VKKWWMSLSITCSSKGNLGMEGVVGIASICGDEQCFNSTANRCAQVVGMYFKKNPFAKNGEIR
jgi:hypothetical protein